MRIPFEQIDDSLVGRTIREVSHVGEDPLDRNNPHRNEAVGLLTDPPTVRQVTRIEAHNDADGNPVGPSVTLHVGEPLMALHPDTGDPDGIHSWHTEYGVGPGGWIETV